MPRRVLLLLAALTASILCCTSAWAQTDDPGSENVPPTQQPPKAWILVDANSGAVLDGTNIHQARPPASTAKLMTALVAMEHLPFDAQLTISQRAAALPPLRISAQPGQKWRFQDLLNAAMLASANDAAYALAEGAGGNLKNFAKDMNSEAHRFGMRDSTFSDPAGLDDKNSFEGGPSVSVYDLAIAARNVLSVPQLAKIVRQPIYYFTGPDGVQHHVLNHDKLLGTYPGAVGLKTGYTERAGRTLVAAATHNGRTMIAIVFDVYDTYGWATRLLDQGFATSPNAQGTGEVLPKPAVKIAENRNEILTGLPRAAGRPVLEVAGGSHANQQIVPVKKLNNSPSTTGDQIVKVFRYLLIGIVTLFVIIVLLRIRARQRRKKKQRMQKQKTAEMHMRQYGRHNRPFRKGRHSPKSPDRV